MRCAFTYHLLGSNELGFGPFAGSEFAVTVDNASGLITDVFNQWNGDQFMRQVGDAFTEWLTTTHPESTAAMSAGDTPALTPESLALWEQYRQEYVQHVLGTTPVTAAP